MTINWTEIRDQMQADLVTGDWKTKAYWIGSRKREFRDISEYLKLLQYVENKAGIQSGSMVGRTYAKPIRRR
jgi:hypothetical protein